MMMKKKAYSKIWTFERVMVVIVIVVAVAVVVVLLLLIQYMIIICKITNLNGFD